MLLGIDINYLYIGVLSALLFCMLFAGAAWLFIEIREWKRRRKNHEIEN